MVDLVLHGGRVIDPYSGIDADLDILIRDGIVAGLHKHMDLSEHPGVVDITGCIVCPGFVDLHTHLRFPGFPEKETIVSGTAASAAGGFTTVCAMANTRPVVDSVEILQEVHRALRHDAHVRVHQLAAVTTDLQGRELVDMRALAGAGVPAFSDDGKPVRDPEMMLRALREAGHFGRPVSAHEEDPDIVRHGVANDGPSARRLGLPLWPCSGEARMIERDIAQLQRCEGHLHIAHVSCREAVDAIRRAKERGLRITAEVTPHHLRLTDAVLDGDDSIGLGPAHPWTKVNPPLRSADDVRAVIDGLSDGTIDAVATDHAPHSREDKIGPYTDAAFGISALETALPLCLDLVREGRLDLPTLIERMTSGPARVFRLDAGTLRPGVRADVCVFDPEEQWTVSEAALLSSGKNTPMMGMVLRGKVRMTLVNGEPVYRSPDGPTGHDDRVGGIKELPSSL